MRHHIIKNPLFIGFFDDFQFFLYFVNIFPGIRTSIYSAGR